MQSKPMPSDEQITRRLAEMRGWNVYQESGGNVVALDNGHGYLITQIRPFGAGRFVRTFNPLDDRNTAHECMLAMPKEKRHVVCRNAELVLWNDTPGGDIMWLFLTATPRQLCMAMYAALERE